MEWQGPARYVGTRYVGQMDRLLLPAPVLDGSEHCAPAIHMFAVAIAASLLPALAEPRPAPIGAVHPALCVLPGSR